MIRFVSALAIVLAIGQVQAAPLPPDLAAVPGNAIGFIHIRVADIWKCDALKEMRDTVLMAGKQALEGFDKRFVPTPSSIDRLTVVMVTRGEDLEEEPYFYFMLGMNKAFDKDQLLKSAMPDAKEQKTTNGSYWTDKKTNLAVSFIDNQTLVFGKSDHVKQFIDNRASGPGPLTDVIKSADFSKHITVAGNLSLIPAKAHQEIPPQFRPLAAARTALLTFDLGDNTKIDLALNYEDAQAAGKALVVTQDLAKMGRDLIKKNRAEVLNAVLGDGKLAPLDKLPEAAVALVALGGMERADQFLIAPPIKQEAKALKLSMTMPTMSYAAMAPIAVGLLLPAVQKVREAAGRMDSMNNLKQIGIAMHTCHDQDGCLPPAAICDKKGNPLLSWRVAILPYIEQQNLYNQFKLDEPWDSENNKKLIPLMPRTYFEKQGEFKQNEGKTFYRVFHGNRSAFSLNEKNKTIQGIEDGSSNTGLVFQMADPVIWTKPDDMLYQPKKPLPKFSTIFPQGFLVLFADGRVTVVPATTPEKTLHAIIDAADGIAVELP